MKRLTTILLSLLLLLSLSATAFADVIYIPEDPFLESHVLECDEMRRGFRALTEVTVYQSPESAIKAGTLAQDEMVHIYYTYTDGRGNQWGYCEDYESGVSGWLPMAYTELVYDFISFEEDYGDLFLSESGQLGPEYCGQEIRFWSYPGSETCSTHPLSQQAEEYRPEYQQVYTDDAGRRWGYIGYYMGHRNCWICLDDPTADFETLYPSGAPEVEITEHGETEPTLPEEPIVPAQSMTNVLICLAVIATVAVTVVLLIKLKKQK